jgi:hypothetical protein
MSDLTEDYYDDRVTEFLKERGVANAPFIVAVDENGRAFPFAGPGTNFRRIQDVGQLHEDPKGGSAWWCFESNPGVTAGAGGGIWRWP